MTRTVKKYLRNSGLSAALLHHAPVVHMTYEQRRRSRQQLSLDNGEALHLLIERGQVLLPGDVLVADDGGLICVRAQNETLIRVTADSAIDLTRAAYHLGNRHVTVEVGEDYLQLEHDPVLTEMLHLLGVHTATVDCPFNPEHGAYGGGHKHGHDETFEEDYSLAQAAYRAHDHVAPHTHSHEGMLHSHSHDHSHDHGHGHEHDQSNSHSHARSHEHNHGDLHPLSPSADHGHHHN